jgi:hypothetical protein
MTDVNSVTFDADYLRVSVGVDEPEILIDVYEQFADNVQTMLSVLESPGVGRKAVYSEVHKNKASSRSVGGFMLADVLDRFEPAILDESRDFTECFDPIKQAATATLVALQDCIDGLRSAG